MSDRVTAIADGPVSIDLLASWFADQAQPDTGCDVSRWWQAHDRTTGRELPITGWSLEADGRTVTVQEALAGHVYTVSFLATQGLGPDPDVQLPHQRLGRRPLAREGEALRRAP